MNTLTKGSFISNILRLLEAAAEAEAKEAAEANAKAINLDSDDDDVQFISTTFDPSIAAKQQQVTLQNKSLAEALATASQVQSSGQQIQMNPATAAKYVYYTPSFKEEGHILVYLFCPFVQNKIFVTIFFSNY